MSLGNDKYMVTEEKKVAIILNGRLNISTSFMGIAEKIAPYSDIYYATDQKYTTEAEYLEKKYGAAAMMAYTSTGKYGMEDYVWCKKAGVLVAREDQEWANEEQPEFADENMPKTVGPCQVPTPGRKQQAKGKGRPKMGTKKKGV